MVSKVPDTWAKWYTVSKVRGTMFLTTHSNSNYIIYDLVKFSRSVSENLCIIYGTFCDSEKYMLTWLY